MNKDTRNFLASVFGIPAIVAMLVFVFGRPELSVATVADIPPVQSRSFPVITIIPPKATLPKPVVTQKPPAPSRDVLTIAPSIVPNPYYFSQNNNTNVQPTYTPPVQEFIPQPTPYVAPIVLMPTRRTRAS